MIQPLSHERDGDHLSGCGVLTWRQIAHEMGEEPPAADDFYDQGGIVQCVEGCPERERSRQHALQVARDEGWLTDEGWIWEREAES